MLIKAFLKRLRDVVVRKSGLATQVATQVATKERLDATCEFVHRHISEMIYQTIFLNKKHPITFYPVGWAANYSFLYLIDRIMEENDIRRVIEFGAGQTTLLFSLWRKKKSFVFYSVEHEEFWKEEMIKKTGENVVLCPLRKFSYKNVDTTFYDMNYFQDNGNFDLIVVDGPPAYMYDRYARLGIIDFLKRQTATDFIIIMDDAERIGEQTSIEEIRKMLSHHGSQFIEHEIKGSNCQHIFLTNKFRRVSYY